MLYVCCTALGCADDVYASGLHWAWGGNALLLLAVDEILWKLCSLGGGYSWCQHPLQPQGGLHHLGTQQRDEVRAWWMLHAAWVVLVLPESSSWIITSQPLAGMPCLCAPCSTVCAVGVLVQPVCGSWPPLRLLNSCVSLLPAAVCCAPCSCGLLLYLSTAFCVTAFHRCILRVAAVPGVPS